MTLTLARDGVLASRQGGPCEASPATQIFGFSQPPALVEPPLPPAESPAKRPGSLVVDHNTVGRLSHFKKNINNAQFRSPPPHARRPPTSSRVPPIIVSFLLPACRPNRQNTRFFFQPHHQRRGIITLASSTRPQRHPSRPEILTALPATMSGANSWLARQRKSDLVELAQTVGLKEYVHFHPQRM